ncbi:hypothetical protein HYN59_09630 [Flavobacterium album]|uniref:Uncharacterized protein n=1 Tax=Flavobacterium album TaxID=2175091 RepID=A0A2S1QY88_9FLAO|nr:hypothetical protein [Flavobacterium album]AWH85358.1 hypothetical protein HYN59_09630 [Flavobacterium album]
MKPLKLILSVIAFVTCTFSQAQVSVNINLGNPPAWGPSGYTEVRYYYLPDIYSYYDVGTHEFIYTKNGTWVRTTALPPAYTRYNLYNGYKVVLTDYRGATPYVYYKTHKVKYPKGYRPGPQKTIGLPPGQAKKLAAGHPHAQYRGTAKGHGHGHGKGKKH